MVLQEWDERFSIGVPSLDAQHHEMVKLLNALYDALQDGHGQEVLGGICKDLVRYAQTHCSYEEALMAAKDYPDLTAHRKEHDDFRHQTFALMQKAETGGLTPALETLRVMKDWLGHHIGGTDRALGQFLKERGVR